MLVFRLAWRNLWRNPRRTGIIVGAVAVGIAGVVLSMAVNYGMVVQMVDNAISSELGHVQIHARGFSDNPRLGLTLHHGDRLGREALEGLRDVRAWSPRIRAQGLVFSPRASAGVRVVAVDPKREAGVSRLERSVVAGEYLGETPRRILLGANLAERLRIGVGAKIVLSVQDLAGDLSGEAFRVGGLFQTASLDLDRTTVYLRLDEAQRLFKLEDGVSELVVVANEFDRVSALAAELRGSLGDEVEVQTWEEIQPFLVYMVDLFDQMAWWTYVGVFVAMAFGIANVLLMAVYERIREIGVMRSIGLGGRRVVAMVMVESTLLVILGLGIGFAISLATVFGLRDGIDLSRWSDGLAAFGVGSRIIPVVRVEDFFIPTVVAVVTALVASLWPALRAAREQPAEALRHV